MESVYKEENEYILAKKRVKEIKAFYMHLAVNIFSIITIVSVNLIFSPHYHWFWYAVLGIVIAQLIHGIVVFGFPGFGFDKNWEERKINEILEKNGKNR
ncbi:2TM domain-containing protein [Tenacibaculum insulae]|uniref:2TM domain-containing protein n=1 Tax=Tenacibaculum insulae TaxID=2029677 RepID=UPI003AB2654F